MTTPNYDSDELRARLAAMLREANTPLTVAPNYPSNLVDDEIGFYDERFDTIVHLARSRLEELMTERPARAVVNSLEELSEAYEIADAVEAGNPYGGGQTVSTVAQRFTDRALDQGIISLTAECDQMSVDVPINAIGSYPANLFASRAVEVMENELDRITGTTLSERLEMTTPLGRQIADDTLTLTGQDEETRARYAELDTRVSTALEAASSPLSSTPTSTLHGPEEIGFLDSRFYTTMYLSLDQLEELLASRPLEDVVSSLENLSVAEEIIAAVQAGDHLEGKDEVRIPAQGRLENALDHGIVSIHPDRYAMPVDVPIESISLDSVDHIGFRAMDAMEDEVNRITGTTLAERLEMETPIRLNLHHSTQSLSGAEVDTVSPFDTAPFEVEDPFTSPSPASEPDSLSFAPTTDPEIEPGHAPGM